MAPEPTTASARVAVPINSLNELRIEVIVSKVDEQTVNIEEISLVRFPNAHAA